MVRPLIALACAAFVFGLQLAMPSRCSADEVLDWNVVLQRAVRLGATPGAVQARLMAIVHASIFDGI